MSTYRISTFMGCVVFLAPLLLSSRSWLDFFCRGVALALVFYVIPAICGTIGDARAKRKKQV